MTTETETDLARAGAILAAMKTTLDLIDADTAARSGRGGSTQILANVRQALAFNASEHARSWNLPWAGQTVVVPAIPNGGE